MLLMNDDTRKVEVSIMGKRYPIVCPPQHEEKLAEAVSFLNEKIAELKQKTKSTRTDTAWNRDNMLAIIALNLSYELLKMNTTVSDKALAAEKLVERIKNSFAQLDADDMAQKISEMSL